MEAHGGVFILRLKGTVPKTRTQASQVPVFPTAWTQYSETPTTADPVSWHGNHVLSGDCQGQSTNSQTDNGHVTLPRVHLLPIAQSTETTGGLLLVGVSTEPCGLELGQSYSVLLGLVQAVPLG